MSGSEQRVGGPVADDRARVIADAKDSTHICVQADGSVVDNCTERHERAWAA